MNLDLKSVILNKKEPAVIKNTLKWGMLKWTLKDWESVLHNEILQFRIGLNDQTDEPQWERKTKSCEGDFNYFLTHADSNTKEWLYFDYKQLNEWFINNERLRKEIDWSPLGFTDIKPDDSTIWIGTKGAHTPCHMDCYGFNLVYQVYGKKVWLLCPPEENLKPTRVPYEESSIYSKLNFFCPKIKDFKGIDNKFRKVELNPGDVLYVPHKWWHYVENLETSISVNVWLPSIEDDEERLQESIVQFIIKNMATLLASNENRTLLNPNMDNLIIKSDPKSFLDSLIKCKQICKGNCNNKRLHVDTVDVKENSGQADLDSLVQAIPILTKVNFLAFLEQQNNKFVNGNQNVVVDKKLNSEYIDIAESLTHPEVINLIKNIIVKSKSK